jgi:hypothetical protein
MRISRGSLIVAVAVLAVAGILAVACAAPPPTPPPPPPPPVPNESPVISKVAASPAAVISGDSTTITATAADPDDDPITYSWSASEGTITGTGSQVTWTSPNKSGDFKIDVTVKDNRGGQTTGSVTVAVSPTTMTVTLNPVDTETGTVDQKNHSDYSVTRAGDDDKNVGYRAFWSFNIASLLGKDIQNATLKFTTGRIYGTPLAYNMPPLGLGGLWLWKDTYGSALPAFGYTGAKLMNTGLMYEEPTEVDVTTEVKLPASYGNNRFQVEALFNKVSNGNNVADMIEWSSVVLEVTYATK